MQKTEIQEKCYECGRDVVEMTFLSETFGFNGGTMVFECPCGNTITRDFTPTDLLPEIEQMRGLLKRCNVEDSIIEDAISHLKVQRMLKK